MREDFGICEETQKNYASGAFTTGPLSPRHEKGVVYFQEKVKEAAAKVGEQASEAAKKAQDSANEALKKAKESTGDALKDLGEKVKK